MGKYMDIMVTPVLKRVTATYTRLSRTFSKIWREHGALEYRESMADDVSVGKRTSFPRSGTSVRLTTMDAIATY